MKRTILIPTAPLSINKYKCRDQRYLTSAAHTYIGTVLHLISEEKNVKKLKELRDYFDPDKHAYKLNLTFYYPRDIFYTQKGLISAKSHDLSNIEKVLIDILFLPKHFGSNPPHKAQNLNIDDKYIVDLNSSKRASEDHLIEVEFEIIDLNSLDTSHLCD